MKGINCKLSAYVPRKIAALVERSKLLSVLRWLGCLEGSSLCRQLIRFCDRANFVSWFKLPLPTHLTLA